MQAMHRLYYALQVRPYDFKTNGNFGETGRWQRYSEFRNWCGLHHMFEKTFKGNSDLLYLPQRSRKLTEDYNTTIYYTINTTIPHSITMGME